MHIYFEEQNYALFGALLFHSIILKLVGDIIRMKGKNRTFNSQYEHTDWSGELFMHSREGYFGKYPSS